jgi:hypothetical protein
MVGDKTKSLNYKKRMNTYDEMLNYIRSLVKEAEQIEELWQSKQFDQWELQFDKWENITHKISGTVRYYSWLERIVKEYPNSSEAILADKLRR